MCHLSCIFYKQPERLTDLEYVVLLCKGAPFSANIEKDEFFFLKSKQCCQPAVSYTCTYYGYIIYLVIFSPQTPFVSGMAWGSHCRPVCS